MARKAVLVTVGIILVAGAAVWLLLPQVYAGGAHIIVGRVTVPVVALAVLWKVITSVFPDGAKLLVARVLRRAGYLPLELKRIVVGNEVEGNLNRAVKEFGCEGSRLLPHPASVQWVSPGEISADSFFRDGRVIIKLDYSENPHRNIVESSLLYCRTGLVPETRRYLWDEFRRALDLVFVRAVLERNDLREGSLYFTQEVVGRELKGNPGVQQDYDTLGELHEHGFLTRLLLPELRDYAGRVHNADTEMEHRSWISDFVGFLVEITREHPSGTRSALDHIGKRFRVSVIIVGIVERLKFEGQRPYLKRIAKCASLGARTVFLVGFSDAIPWIAGKARELGIVDSAECQSYYGSRRGSVKRMWCAQLRISEETAAYALARVPGMEDWPEFEAAFESEEARPQAQDKG